MKSSGNTPNLVFRGVYVSVIFILLIHKKNAIASSIQQKVEGGEKLKTRLPQPTVLLRACTGYSVKLKKKIKRQISEQ